MTKVSVIIPYLNGPSYLEECVQSIENQNRPDLEVLLVDDRGGDAVPVSVLEKEFVRHIVLERERDPERTPFDVVAASSNETGSNEKGPFGVAAARNAGVRHAKGEYLYFLDADDYLWEDALTRLVELADEKGADVVTGNRCFSWFRPVSFTVDGAQADTEVKGIAPLRDEALLSVLADRFTVQHLLVRTAYFNGLDLEFDEQNMFYSDAFVAAGIFLFAGSVWADGSSRYVCRLHNDPIHLPSLSQKKAERRTRDFIESYEAACRIWQGEVGEGKKWGGLYMKYPGHLNFALDMKYAFDLLLVRFAVQHFPGRLNGEVARRFTRELREIPKEEWKRIKRSSVFSKRGRLAV